MKFKCKKKKALTNIVALLPLILHWINLISITIKSLIIAYSSKYPFLLRKTNEKQPVRPVFRVNTFLQWSCLVETSWLNEIKAMYTFLNNQQLVLKTYF